MRGVLPARVRTGMMSRSCRWNGIDGPSLWFAGRWRAGRGPVEVGLPQPLVVAGIGVEDRRGDRDARVVEHRGQRSRQPSAYLRCEPVLADGFPYVEIRRPDQRYAGVPPQAMLGPRGLTAPGGLGSPAP